MVKVPFDLAHWRQIARSTAIRTAFQNLIRPIRRNGYSMGARLAQTNHCRSLSPECWGIDGRGRQVPSSSIVPRLSRTASKSMPTPMASFVSAQSRDGRPPMSDCAHYLPTPMAWIGLLAKLPALLSGVGFEGDSLDDWLRDGFFAQHCELFHQRPFIWHIWDGRRDGFNALVNYHRLAGPNGEARGTLEKLIFTYLGEWIEVQREDQKKGVEGADGRLAAAIDLQSELKNILEGEQPYDLFVRWKPLREQPIGWEPDLNDGIRVNIRPFMTARLKGARAANACILRVTPKNIKWEKDRGKEPHRAKEDFPWFWGWDEETIDFAGGRAFDGNRWNDLHYTIKAKREAQGPQPVPKAQARQ